MKFLSVIATAFAISFVPVSTIVAEEKEGDESYLSRPSGVYNSGSSYGPARGGVYSGQKTYGYSGPARPTKGYNSKDNCCKYEVDFDGDCMRFEQTDVSRTSPVRIVCELDIDDDECFKFHSGALEAVLVKPGQVGVTAKHSFTIDFVGEYGSIQVIGSGSILEGGEISGGVIGGTDKKHGASGKFDMDIEENNCGGQTNSFTIGGELSGMLCLPFQSYH